MKMFNWELSTGTSTVFFIMMFIYILMIIWAFAPMDQTGFKQILGHAFVPSLLVLALLGIAEFLLTIRERRCSSNTKGLLLLCALAAVGTPLSIVLHNVISYMAGIWFAAPEEGFFFILAVIVFPVVFVVGAAGVVMRTFLHHSAVSETSDSG